jgi:hypothetical protein
LRGKNSDSADRTKNPMPERSENYSLNCDPGGTNFKPDLGGFEAIARPPLAAESRYEAWAAVVG